MDSKILDVARWLIGQAQAFGAGSVILTIHVDGYKIQTELTMHVDGYKLQFTTTKNDGDNQSRDDA